MDKYKLIEGGLLASYAIMSVAIYTYADSIQCNAYMAGNNISILIGYPILKYGIRKIENKYKVGIKKNQNTDYSDSDEGPY